ncbi:hypothetical protein COL26b_008454 [Colletotrichum chrysophilum]|uniref:uncharacterized protein n=1 Tax=Colletotrichum chrysophilum TaxID=1836956 RepID=UPI002300AA72|nr:uncharacterized protein COL26b_008454 [Colletotrichum chrysophilum]KAJ0373327.1 hypothetical protein COL26b_008454 [Colletotrichum chrysophilum]
MSEKLWFQNVMALAPLPPPTPEGKVKRYMSLWPAWVPGSELVGGKGRGSKADPRAAYGGHVYTQAPLAACRALEEEEPAGTVRQPKEPSKRLQADDFNLEDLESELGDVCFSCICTFKRPEEGRVSSQEVPPQERFGEILKAKAPGDWPKAPAVDVEEIKAMFPDASGHFPIVDMHKVDLTGWNEGKPVTERRELLFYRLRGPLPADDPNQHVLVHAFESDRNGLLMVGNHIGLGWSLGTAASLTYAFVVHVNVDEAVMKDPSGAEDGWWIQEVSFPRAGQGRGALMCKMWSPSGVHVATGYQDGIIRERKVEKEKL